jgi:hypothetical protein
MSIMATVCSTIFTYETITTAMLTLLFANMLEHMYKNVSKECERKKFTYIVAHKFIRATRDPCEGIVMMCIAKLLCRVMNIFPVTWFHTIFS